MKRVIVMTDHSKLEGTVSLGDLITRGKGMDMHAHLSQSRPNN